MNENTKENQRGSKTFQKSETCECRVLFYTIEKERNRTTIAVNERRSFKGEKEKKKWRQKKTKWNCMYKNKGNKTAEVEEEKEEEEK